MIKSRSMKRFLFIVFIAISCKERFDPKLSPVQSNYLIVEGYLNAEGISTIRLGRTVPLKDTARIKNELRAQVTIEGEDNSRFSVKEAGKGYAAHR